jgi:hypothetical protein
VGANEAVTPDRVPAWSLAARIRNVRGTILVAGREQVFELDDSAAFVWRQIDGTRTIGEIGQALAAEYDVDPEGATRDVVEFVDDLVASEILIVRDS